MPHDRLWDKFEVFTEHRVYANEFEFYLVRHEPDGRHTSAVQPVEFKVQTEAAGRIMQPAFALPRPVVVNIMAELWRLGVRPPGVHDDTDRVAAMRAHIEDLRAHIKSLHDIISDRANTV